MNAGDRRGTHRVPVNVPAILQSLGRAASENGTPVAVRILDASQNGMRVLSPLAFAPGQTVKLETRDALFLGEICYCAPVPPPGGEAYSIGIVSEECLTGLAALERLIRALRPDPDSEPVTGLEPRR
jgi:hypothetical protein